MVKVLAFRCGISRCLTTCRIKRVNTTHETRVFIRLTPSTLSTISMSFDQPVSPMMGTKKRKLTEHHPGFGNHPQYGNIDAPSGMTEASVYVRGPGTLGAYRVSRTKLEMQSDVFRAMLRNQGWSHTNGTLNLQDDKPSTFRTIMTYLTQPGEANWPAFLDEICDGFIGFATNPMPPEDGLGWVLHDELLDIYLFACKYEMRPLRAQLTKTYLERGIKVALPQVGNAAKEEVDDGGEGIMGEVDAEILKEPFDFHHRHFMAIIRMFGHYPSELFHVFFVVADSYRGVKLKTLLDSAVCAPALPQYLMARLFRLVDQRQEQVQQVEVEKLDLLKRIESLEKRDV